MKTLLDFFKTYQIFLPFDMEFTLPEAIRLYTVLEDVVSTIPDGITDNGYPHYKKLEMRDEI